MQSQRRVFVWVATVTVAAATLPLFNASPALAARVKTIIVADASIVEGDVGQQNLAFKITWSGSKGGAAPSVHYDTADTSTTAGADYAVTSGTTSLTNGGCRCATVNVPIKGDALSEGTETFTLNLSSPLNGTIGDPQAIGTIYDNEGDPVLVVGDTSVAESSATMSFTVQLTNASPSTVTVDYATADGTAAAGADYTATSATLTFLSGQTSKTVAVAVSDDLLAEDGETVLFDLTNPTNAAVLDARGVGTILDDDVDPTATIADINVAEGDTGAGTATFTVTLDAPSGRETAVDYATSDATAAAGEDYTATNATLTIPAGETSGTFDVSVDGDLLHEGDETFSVALSGEVNLTLGNVSATGTITDEDPVPTLDAQDISIGESAATVSVTLALSNPTTSEVTANWATGPGTATPGSDYADASGSTSIPAGSTSVTVDVTTLGDKGDEPNETFTVSVSGVVNATAGAAGAVTITDDDKTPTALTLKAGTTRAKVIAKGILESAAKGARVKILLQRTKGTKWVQVAVKTVTVRNLGDRDGDGKKDAAYLAAFPKPAKGTYRFRASFAGTTNLKRCKKLLTFKR